MSSPADARTALLRGMIAGLAGSAAQDLFQVATRALFPITPIERFDAFPGHKGAKAVPSAARRAARQVAGVELGGPDAMVRRAVHYAYGSAWGAAFGVLSTRVDARPATAVALSLFVWAISENVLMPALGMSGRPERYPARNHGYAIAAHLAYAAGLYWAFPRTRARTRALAR